MRSYTLAVRRNNKTYYLADIDILLKDRDEIGITNGKFIWTTKFPTDACSERQIVEDLSDNVKEVRPDLDIQIVGEGADDDF